MITEQRKFLEHAKRNYLSSQLTPLIQKDSPTDTPNPKAILQLLVSQFASALADSSLMNMGAEPYNFNSKLPVTMLFALFRKQIDSGQLNEAAKLLTVHLERKNKEKVFILIYNLTKIYQLQLLPSKRIFYLQTLLKEQPFFPEAVYDLALAYLPSRLPEALNLLQRHIRFGNSNNPLIHSAFIYSLSFANNETFEAVKHLQNQRLTLQNYFNLGLLFRKKGQHDRAFTIFSDLISRIESFFNTSDRQIMKQDLQLLLLSKLNLLKIKQEQGKISQAIDIANMMLEDDIDVLDPETRKKLQQISLKQMQNANFNRSNYSQYFQTRNQFFRLTSNNQKAKKKSNVTAHKTEGSFAESILGEVKNKNNKKLQHLLNKQKNIDNFFKNIVVKYNASDSVQIGLKNSLQMARNQLHDGSRGLAFEEYEELEEQFQKSRQFQAVELDSCDVEESIKLILQNLKNIKNNTIVKPQTHNSSRKHHQATLSRNSVRKQNPALRSQPKKSNFHVNKHSNLKSQRNLTNMKIKNFLQNTKGRKQVKKQTMIVNEEVPNSNIFPQNDFIITPNSKQEKDSFVKSLVSSRRSYESSLKKIEEISQKNLEEDSSSKNIEKSSSKKVEKTIFQISNRTSQKSIYQNRKSSNQISSKEVKQQPLENNLRRQNSLNIMDQKTEQGIEQNAATAKSTKRSLQIIKQITRKSQEQTAKLEESRQKNTQKVLVPKTDSITCSNQLLKSGKSNEGDLEHFLDVSNQLEQKDEEKAFLHEKNKSNLTQITESNLIKKDQKDEKADKNDEVAEQKNPFTNLLASSFKITKSPNAKKYKKQNSKPLGVSNSVTNAFRNLRNNQAAQSSQRSKESEGDFNKQMLKITELQKHEKWKVAYQKLLELYKIFKKTSQKLQILLRIGCNFEKQQKFAEAEKTFIKCTKFNSADAFLFLGNLQLKIGKIEEGVQNLEKANCIKRFDITIENKLVYGYSLREETMDKALKLAHNILKKEPNSLETLLITAGILEKQGLVDEAIQIVKAIDQVRQTQHIKHYLGILHLAASNLQQAFSFFKEALAIKPDYVPSLIETASIVSQSYPRQAISILTKALQLNPGNRRALARLGKIYQAQSDFENAMATYKAALETQQNYESYMKIGDCLSKKESYIEALLNYKQASNMKKTSQAYAKMALMYEYKNDFSKAIDNYQNAIEIIEPTKEADRRRYLLSIGRLQLKMGQYQTAISMLEEVLAGMESVQIFKLLGEAYFGNRMYSESLSYFQKANQMTTGIDLDVLENMAICLDRMEQYMASKAIYEKILQKNPGNIRCLNNLGNIFLIIGQTNEAFYLFQSILEKQPKNVEKRLKIADIYAQVGDWSKVQYHLLQCYRQKEHDTRILEKLVVLYKQKRDNKMAAKYEKKLNLLKGSKLKLN